MGRPKKELSVDEFEKLCALQCTQEEICGWFDVHDETLTRWIKETYGEESSFSEIFRLKKGKGKISLRRNMWKQAEKSAAVAIFLAKNHLGMKDKQEIDHRADNISINYSLVQDD